MASLRRLLNFAIKSLESNRLIIPTILSSIGWATDTPAVRRSTVSETSPVAVHRQSQGVQLCLNKAYQADLPSGFEFIGLTVSEDVGPKPVITLWSRSALHVLEISPTQPTVQSIASAMLFSIDPLSIVPVAWNDEGLEAQLFDALSGSIWTMDVATGHVTRVAGSVDSPPASGAIRGATGWVQAHKIVDVIADTAGITIVRVGQALPPEYAVDSTMVARTGRNVDRILHVRPLNDDGFLVSEAAFPFATVAFSSTGQELSRTYADVRQLRTLLAERDLRYVIATPTIALDGGVLSTFVALRSGQRVSVVRSPGGTDLRYGHLPEDLAFLANIRDHRLLVATRAGDPHQLLLYRWRWIDQRQICA